MAREYGIDLTRIYFREEICELWGYQDTEDEANQRRWFKRNFIDKGLKTFPSGGRVAVHGQILGDWVAYNSNLKIE